MNSDDRDLLIRYFGVACANIDSALDTLNAYEQDVMDGVSDTKEDRERRNNAIERATKNTKRALDTAKAIEKDIDKFLTNRTAFVMLEMQIIKIETAFDEANAEAGEAKRSFIAKAIYQAGFAKRNCYELYELLNKPTNKGGSRKHKSRHALRKRTHRNKKRTHRSRK